MDFSKRAKYYSMYRKADERLTLKLLSLLKIEPSATIADIGAGIGSYSIQFLKLGYNVYSIEPEKEMRKNAVSHEIKWINSFAEKIDLPDSSIDSAIAINSIHHFSDINKSVKEIFRIIKHGKFAIFTFDPSVSKNLWLFDYWPELLEVEIRNYIPINELKENLEETFHSNAIAYKYDLPFDFSDLFSAALWQRPSLLLDPKIFKAMSLFSSGSETMLMQGLETLQKDIESGKWDNKYNYLLFKDAHDVGIRIIIVDKD